MLIKTITDTKQLTGWLVPITSAHKRLKQEDQCEPKASLGYTVRAVLKNTEKNKIKNKKAKMRCKG